MKNNSKKTNLITVPTFIFRQGTHSGEDFEENVIQVSFYNNGIEISQEGNFTDDESVIISYKYLDALFKAIKNELPKAQEILKK